MTTPCASLEKRYKDQPTAEVLAHFGYRADQGLVSQHRYLFVIGLTRLPVLLIENIVGKMWPKGGIYG